MTENVYCDLRNIGTKTTEKNCHHQLHHGHCSIIPEICVSPTSSWALYPIYNSNLPVCVPLILSQALCTTKESIFACFTDILLTYHGHCALVHTNSQKLISFLTEAVYEVPQSNPTPPITAHHLHIL